MARKFRYLVFDANGTLHAETTSKKEADREADKIDGYWEDTEEFSGGRDPGDSGYGTASWDNEVDHWYGVLRNPRGMTGTKGLSQIAAEVAKLLPVGVASAKPSKQIAADLGISKSTLDKALAELQKAGLVRSVRGRHGGLYRDKFAGRGRPRKVSPREIAAEQEPAYIPRGRGRPARLTHPQHSAEFAPRTYLSDEEMYIPRGRGRPTRLSHPQRSAEFAPSIEDAPISPRRRAAKVSSRGPGRPPRPLHIRVLQALEGSSASRPRTTEWLAARTKSSKVEVYKVLSSLASTGVVETRRGPHGGSWLAG